MNPKVTINLRLCSASIVLIGKTKTAPDKIVKKIPMIKNPQKVLSASSGANAVEIPQLVQVSVKMMEKT